MTKPKPPVRVNTAPKLRMDIIAENNTYKINSGSAFTTWIPSFVILQPLLIRFLNPYFPVKSPVNPGPEPNIFLGYLSDYSNLLRQFTQDISFKYPQDKLHHLQKPLPLLLPRRTSETTLSSCFDLS